MSLPAHKDLGFGITLIDTEQHRPGLAACYLIRQGRSAALVECGTNPSVPGILATLDSLGVAREQVRYLCPTHVHLDHGGGAGLLMRELPNAQLIAHPRAAAHFIDPSKIKAGATAVYGADMVKQLYGELLPITAERVTVAEDGHRIRIEDRELLFIDSPGHARHHYSIWDAQSQGFFTGDTFGLSYRELDVAGKPWVMPTTTPVQFEPDAWQTTLDRYLSFKPQRMFLTHYGVVDNVAALAQQLRVGLRDYCEIARRHADSSQRHQAILDDLMALSQQRLREHGCSLNDADANAVLAMDAELNAQGLEVWLDKATR